MSKANSKSSTAEPRSEVLSVKCVPLARHLLPSTKFKLFNKLAEQGQAKYLLKKYMRVVQRTEDAVLPSAVALNHWILRTSPDDWWFCVIKRVACAIDKNANKESVRRIFVDHQEKKPIDIVVPDTSIHTVDYSWFFDQIAKGIQGNIKVPEFVDGMTADFRTTTAVQKIVSQITMMNSVQDFFLCEMVLGCGIPAVEMFGTEDDWSKLNTKRRALRKLLEPIDDDLDLSPEWWDLVERVFSNLLDTFQGKPNRKWWSHVMTYKKVYGSGQFIPGEHEYKGWITEFLKGTKSTCSIGDMNTGLVSVPLTLNDSSSDEKETATLVAGMLGFTLHEASVQPFQGWALLLPEDSTILKRAER